METGLRQLVIDRAGNRCEYCRLHQRDVPAKLQVDHIVAKQHRGGDDESNLALACYRCNLCKLSNLSSVDPASSAVVPLFHPRTDRWSDHFKFDGPLIVGLSASGRATVELLQMNSPDRVELRFIVGTDDS